MSRGEFRSWQAHPPHGAALRAVLSGPTPERYKVLTVLCPRYHVLGRVYRTTAGLMLLHQTEGVHKLRPPIVVPGGLHEPVELPPQRGPRADWNAYVLQDGQGLGSHTFPMQCRCFTATPRHSELLQSIREGKKQHRVS